jgi:hypothetical protein
VRALLHERYEQLFEGVCAGKLPDVAAIADVRAAAVYATDIAIGRRPRFITSPAIPACITRTSSAGCCAI